MKKIIITFLSLILIFVLSFFIYLNLPISITRKSEITFGEELIRNIENYRTETKKIPELNDWKTLENLGFKMELLGTKPIFQVNEKGNEYELVYVEGFDGPYLMWNSIEKKWKVDFPKIFDNPYKNYEKTNVVFQNQNESIFYDVTQTGIDNYTVKFFSINKKSDTSKLAEIYINDALFTRKTFKVKKSENKVKIISNLLENQKLKTKSGIMLELKSE